MIFLFFFSWLLATGNIDLPQDTPDYGAQFSSIITKASIRLQEAAEKRSLRLKNWNDSIAVTAAAVRAMAGKKSPEEIYPLLAEARRIHPKNNFAILLQGLIRNSQGDTEGANRLFREFLYESRTFTEFEEGFLKWGEFHLLRRVIYQLLKSRGISFEGDEKKIQVNVPYEAFFQYVMNPSRQDFWMNVLFVVLIVAGGFLLAAAGLRGADFTASAGSFAAVYVMIWVAYGLWIFDLAFGLPFGWSRMTVVPVFLGISCGTVFLSEIILWFKERSRPVADGYKKCPFCREVILELAIECPYCRKKIEN